MEYNEKKENIRDGYSSEDTPAWSEPAYREIKEENVYSPSYYGRQTTYGYSPISQNAPRKKAENNSGAAGIVIMCAIISALVSLASAYLVTSIRLEGANQQVIIGSAHTPAGDAVQNETIHTQNALSANQIYEMGKLQVVGISTKTTVNVFGQPTSMAVSGSGFIISEDGYILTNYHVIEYSVLYGDEITVMTSDAQHHSCRIIGYDKQNDIAVLKIEGSEFYPVTFGNSDDIIVGETVFPIGNPLGELLYTMTSGIVSALDREIATTPNFKISAFQFDAAVNEGNSGGPVYNEFGEVIGIVTAKYASDGVEGLGFAIPINNVLDMVTELIQSGYIGGSPSLGVALQTMDKSYAVYYEVPQGAYVRAVNEGSCAEKAGVRIGDIIISFNGETIISKEEIVSVLSELKAGDEVSMSVFRSGEVIKMKLTLDEKKPALDGA